MSDNYIMLIPTGPQYVPETEAIERARRRLAAFLPEAQDITAKVTEHVEFISAEGNSESISCPACGAALDWGWWRQVMDAAYERRFADLIVRVPCCEAETSLNDLRYHFSQGFARFVLSARYPQIPRLSEQQIGELSEIVGCQLRQVWVHI